MESYGVYGSVSERQRGGIPGLASLSHSHKRHKTPSHSHVAVPAVAMAALLWAVSVCMLEPVELKMYRVKSPRPLYAKDVERPDQHSGTLLKNVHRK